MASVLDLRLTDAKIAISGYGIAFGDYSKWSSEQKSRLRSYLPAENGQVRGWRNGSDQIDDDQLGENQQLSFPEEPEILNPFIYEIESQGMARGRDIANFNPPQLSRCVEVPGLWRLDFANDYGMVFFEENVGFDVLQLYLGDEPQRRDIFVAGVTYNLSCSLYALYTGLALEK